VPGAMCCVVLCFVVFGGGPIGVHGVALAGCVSGAATDALNTGRCGLFANEAVFPSHAIQTRGVSKDPWLHRPKAGVHLCTRGSRRRVALRCVALCCGVLRCAVALRCVALVCFVRGWWLRGLHPWYSDGFFEHHRSNDNHDCATQRSVRSIESMAVLKDPWL